MCILLIMIKTNKNFTEVSYLFEFIKHFHPFNLVDFDEQIFHTRYTLRFFWIILNLSSNPSLAVQERYNCFMNRFEVMIVNIHIAKRLNPK